MEDKMKPEDVGTLEDAYEVLSPEEIHENVVEALEALGFTEDKHDTEYYKKWYDSLYKVIHRDQGSVEGVIQARKRKEEEEAEREREKAEEKAQREAEAWDRIHKERAKYEALYGKNWRRVVAAQRRKSNPNGQNISYAITGVLTLLITVWFPPLFIGLLLIFLAFVAISYFNKA